MNRDKKRKEQRGEREWKRKGIKKGIQILDMLPNYIRANDGDSAHTELYRMQ